LTVDDSVAFTRLIHALRPWLGHLVIVGGWAHRLHRLHPIARAPRYAPLRTRDVDLALALGAPVDGDIKGALEAAQFTPEYFGDNRPPVTHYALADDDAGFYAEFLVPLHGSEVKRGSPDVTVSKAGVNAQKLRHLDILLVAPWSVQIGPGREIAFDEPVDVLVPNPVSFIIQKVLIHDKRKPLKKAQDVLYIHDTLELFGAALDDLRSIWTEEVRPAIAAKTAKRAEQLARSLFEQVTDTIREAARIRQDRRLTPDGLQAACAYGTQEIFARES
jgi:hypothetical protein